MKSKVISIIVSAAVMLGLMLIPAMPAALAAGGIGIEVVPQETKVGFGESFEVEIWIDDTPGDDYNAVGVRLVYETKYVSCNAVTDSGVWDYTANCACNDAWNSTHGLITFDATLLGPIFNTSQLACTVNFTSTSNTSNSGISGLDFIFIPADSATCVAHPTLGDVLDWDEAVNGTLKVGSPALTVDVSPAGKGDVDITGSSIPSSYPDVSYWSWDQMVTLEAIDSTVGWVFDSWTGDVANPSAQTTTVTMDVAKSVTANFVELPPILGVDTNDLSFSARFGNSTDNGTVEISNDGGHTLCWAVCSPPTWQVGDWWMMYNTYTPAPTIGALPGGNESNLTILVSSAGPPYEAQVTFDIPLQRTIEGGAPAVLWNATVWVDEYSMDYVRQEAMMTAWLPNMTNIKAIVAWDYDGCHGWPYSLYKSWTYNITTDVITWPTAYPVVHKVIPCEAMVTNVSQVIGPFTDCYEITYATPNMGGTVFMQQWWSPTAKIVVYQWDAGTFDAPPLDMRTLTSFSSAADPPCAPAWLSFDKMAGSLGIGGSETLTVTASAEGLAVGNHTGNFTISAPGSIQEETIACTFEVLEATTIDVIRDLPADAMDQDAEYPGDTFYVWVNFTAPVDDFNAVGLTDLAPAGWDVHTDVSWCNPVADWTLSPGNKAEYAWNGPYGVGQVFSAKYLVTIPATADVGLNDWPDGDCAKAWAEYWFGPVGPFESCITGEWQKLVTVPGTVCGETRDVNADLLTSTMVRLYEEVMVYEDDDSSTAPDALYCNDVDDTGLYWQSASKYCYFTLDTNAMPGSRNPWHEDNIDFSTVALLALGYTMDFEGDYGLVPKACTMSYAMESVNHWLFVPIDGSLTAHSEWQLSSWKAMESVHSWQFPAGCNL